MPDENNGASGANDASDDQNKDGANGDGTNQSDDNKDSLIDALLDDDNTGDDDNQSDGSDDDKDGKSDDDKSSDDKSDDDKKDDDDKSDEDDSKDGKSDEGSFKKVTIGTKTFESVEDLVKFAKSEHGRARDVSGQIDQLVKDGKLSKGILTQITDVVSSKVSAQAKAEKINGAVSGLYKDFPGVEKHKGMIATIIRSKEATDDKGNVNLRLAAAMALRAKGETVPDELQKELNKPSNSGDGKKDDAGSDNNDSNKVIGSGDGKGSVSGGSYKSQGDVDRAGDEADDLLNTPDY